MDTRTGEIILPERLKELFGDMDQLPAHIKPMQTPPTERQLQRRPPKIGRNEPCPCASGKKFKKCCLERKSFRKVYK